MRFSLAIMFQRVPPAATIAELLQSARLPVPERRADRFKDAVEEAFEQLVGNGLVGGWRYENADQDLTRTRWVDKWLRWTVIFDGVPAALSGAS